MSEQTTVDQPQRLTTIFNGTYTLTSPSGEHRTLRVRTQKADASFKPGERLISLLVGPDNEGDYQSFGEVTDNGIKIWRKKMGENGEKSQYEKLATALWSLAVNGEKSFFYEKGMRMLMEGRCIRCNRKLTHPTSIITGIGPECAKR